MVVDVPKNLLVKLSFKISLFIKTISSKMLYMLLSIEENKEDSRVFIVSIIVCVIEVWVGCIKR